MGSDNGQSDESPQHPVWVSGFYVDRLEVSIKQWGEVTDSLIPEGYQFSENQNFPKRGPGWFSGADRLDFPMNMISWFDAVKWCNARSEYMGRLPLYYDSDSNEIIRGQQLSVSNNIAVYWNRSGYRLPTESEWEKAARGIASGYKFPWGNSIDGSMANYKLSGDPFDDGSTPTGYYNGRQEIGPRELSFGGEDRAPSDIKNIYDIYDVVGNVSEWCWDWYEDKWYENSKNSHRDDRGPSRNQLSVAEPTRVHRGGGFKSDNSMESGESLRIAFRGVAYPREYSTSIGIRTVRGDFHDPLWADSIPTIHDSWLFLPWFGYYFQFPNSWAYFSGIGWIYPYGNGSYDNWLYYHITKSWFWTNKRVFPWHYHWEEKKWYELINQNGEFTHFKSHYSEKKISLNYD
jgi:formylglycine-generating enzyme required for sulfatase activity